MSEITSIFKLADILHTPQGFVLAGNFSSNCQQLEDILIEANSYIGGRHSVSYLNDDRELVSLPVKDFQYTTSISNRVNLFVLLDLDCLPHDLTLGTIIYKHEQHTSTAPQSELSTIDQEKQEKIMQITTSWERKGQSNTILRQLDRKLGSLDNAIAEQIKSLNPKQLDDLSIDLLDFQSLENLQAWLSNSQVNQ